MIWAGRSSSVVGALHLSGITAPHHILLLYARTSTLVPVWPVILLTASYFGRVVVHVNHRYIRCSICRALGRFVLSSYSYRVPGILYLIRSGRKYKARLNMNIHTKRSVHLRPEGYGVNGTVPSRVLPDDAFSAAADYLWHTLTLYCGFSCFFVVVVLIASLFRASPTSRYEYIVVVLLSSH